MKPMTSAFRRCQEGNVPINIRLTRWDPWAPAPTLVTGALACMVMPCGRGLQVPWEGCWWGACCSHSCRRGTCLGPRDWTRLLCMAFIPSFSAGTAQIVMPRPLPCTAVLRKDSRARVVSPLQ
jgi:hypothetical protein